MTSYFSADFFTNNRNKLRQRLGTNTPIVVTGNGLMQRGADEPFRFHQDSNFFYLTGLNGVGLTLVIGQHNTYLIVPTLSLEREAFDGAHDLAAYAEQSGITTILNATDGWSRVRGELQSAQTVAVPGSSPSYIKHYGLYTLPYRRQLIAKLKRMKPELEFQDIRADLADMRCIKQPEELQALQRAIDITSETLHDVTRADVLKPIKHEYELEAAMSFGFRSRGAAGHAFDPIVGAGNHGTTLHHVDNAGPIANSDLIVLDVGASVEHYAADITRTVCKQPFNKRQQDVFQAVIAVQDYALSLLKPGTMLKEYEQAVVTFMGSQLQQLGLVTNPTRDQIRHYFPHSTSHFLGLDTHDVGDYRKPLAANMVLTCEPGIYIPEEAIGVRIEDDILITETGNKVLSAACPRVLSPVQ